MQPGKNFWEIYKLFNIHDLKFDGVYFPAMLEQVPKLLALFFVVAFGSCLDVAAIQADSPEPLDYNHELKTVGKSCSCCPSTCNLVPVLAHLTGLSWCIVRFSGSRADSPEPLDYNHEHKSVGKHCPCSPSSCNLVMAFPQLFGSHRVS
jgi:hypothetical protein